MGWTSFARLLYAKVISIREKEYVESARAIGTRNGVIMLRYILPNAVSPALVAFTFGIPSAILSESALSFLGLGVKPPQPEWGALLSSGREFIRDSAYLACIPGVCIMLTILALNLLGDGLRDALDPRLRQ